MLYHPTDLTGVAHSLPYMVAASVVDRTYTWEHAAPEKFMDPVIGALQDKVVGDAEVSPYADRGGGTVTITTKDGRVHSHTFKAPRGSGTARHRMGGHRRQVSRACAARRAVGAERRSEPRRHPAVRRGAGGIGAYGSLARRAVTRWRQQ